MTVLYIELDFDHESKELHNRDKELDRWKFIITQ